MSTTPNQKDLLAKKSDLEGILKPDDNDVLHLPDVTITLAESGQFYLAGIDKNLLTLVGNTSGNAVALDGDAGLTFTTSGGSSTITGITSSSGNSTSLAASQSMASAKQDKIIAGTNIQIAQDGKTISATDTTYSTFNGASASADGSTGLVPKPFIADKDKYLRGDGTWQTIQATPTLNDLTDVDLTTPADGQILKYDATNQEWINANENPGVTTISGLTDVDVTTTPPTNGQGLVYNSTNQKWENGTVSSASSIDTLTDVNLTNLTNGQILKYNSTSQEWENANESGGGGGSTVIPNPTGAPTDTLDTVSIDGTIYEIQGGGGGGSSVTTLFENNGTTSPASITLEDDLTNYDIVLFQLGATSGDAIFTMAYNVADLTVGDTIGAGSATNIFVWYYYTNSTTLTLRVSAGDVYISTIVGIKLSGGEGSSVTPNPQGTPTDTLSTIEIDGTIYDIGEGGGGGSGDSFITYTKTVTTTYYGWWIVEDENGNTLDPDTYVIIDISVNVRYYDVLWYQDPAGDYRATLFDINDGNTIRSSSTRTWTITYAKKDFAGGGGSSALSDLADVTVTSPSDGQVLTYDNTSGKWVNDTPTASSSISTLTDVNLTSLSDGQILKYDATNQEWVNADESGGGSGTSKYTEEVLWSGNESTSRWAEPIVLNIDITDYDMLSIRCGPSNEAGGVHIILTSEIPSGDGTVSLGTFTDRQYSIWLNKDNNILRIFTSTDVSINVKEVVGIKYGSGGGAGDASAEEITLSDYNELTTEEKNDGTIRFIPESSVGVTTPIDMSNPTNISESSRIIITPSEKSVEMTWDTSASSGIGATFYYSRIDVTDYDYLVYDLVTGDSYDSLHPGSENPIRDLGIGLCSSAPSTWAYAPNINWTIWNRYEVTDTNKDLGTQTLDVSELSGEYYLVIAGVAWEATISNLKYATSGGNESQIKYMDKTYGIGSDGEGYTEEVIYSATPSTAAPSTLTLTKPYTDFDMLLFNLYRSVDGVMNKYDRVVLTSKLSLNDRIQLITYNEWASYDITTTTSFTLINEDRMYIGSVVGLKFGEGGGGGGSSVTPNPQGTATDTLSTIEIDGTIYDIEGSGGGSGTYTSTLLNDGTAVQNVLTLSSDYTNYDELLITWMYDNNLYITTLKLNTSDISINDTITLNDYRTRDIVLTVTSTTAFTITSQESGMGILSIRGLTYSKTAKEKSRDVLWTTGNWTMVHPITDYDEIIFKWGSTHSTCFIPSDIMTYESFIVIDPDTDNFMWFEVTDASTFTVRQNYGLVITSIDGVVYTKDEPVVFAEEMTLADYNTLSSAQKNDGTIRFIPESNIGSSIAINMSYITKFKEANMDDIATSSSETTITWDGGVYIGNTYYYTTPIDVTDYDNIIFDLTTRSCYGGGSSAQQTRWNIQVGLMSVAPTTVLAIDATDSSWAVCKDFANSSTVYSDQELDVSELTGSYYLVINAHGWNATLENFILATVGGNPSQIKYMDKTYGISSGGGGGGSGYSETVLNNGTQSGDVYTLSDSISNYDMLEIEWIYNGSYYGTSITSVESFKTNATGILVDNTDNILFVMQYTTETTMTRTQSYGSLEVRQIKGLKFGGGGGSSSHTYSTTEQMVGTWIDGSDLYEKTIDIINSSSVAATRDVSLSNDIPANARVIEAKGMYEYMYGNKKYGFPIGIQYVYGVLKDSEYLLRIVLGSESLQSDEAIITVRYTKSS